jgi:Flp pilus assembly pilin Flp
MLTSFMPLVQALVARVSILRNERGQALVEYALIVGLIAVACVVAIGLLSGAIQTEFSNITSKL